MIQSLYTAASGLYSQQTRIDTIANNIANISTTGFKSSDVGFKDAYYTVMGRPVPGGEGLPKGTGVALSFTARSAAPGNLETTGDYLDFAILGDGFFSLLNSSAEIVYTKNGAFSVSAEEDGNYLTALGGCYVLDNNGERIKLPADLSSFVVSEDGSIETENGTVRIGVFEFPNAGALSSAGNGTFTPTEASGDAVESTGCELRQGVLEGSNVNLATELTKLIQAQRMYSLAGRALQTADEMEGLAINLRR